ncbi:ComEA family DNA-binding protein [Halobacillus trueperi]|uniref:ComEA family DNA-binding protein n=2 Tax=Halobacillus trueperi TaxID=156205 RepID=A0A3E0JCI5_9BACI|nr:ComEA family DNA-binding protein [Halobacillus trueperi]
MKEGKRMSVLKRYVWVFIVLAVTGVLYFFKPADDAESHMVEMEVEQTDTLETVEEAPGSVSVKVDVKGEVHHPGVYTMKEETRVDDAIKEAGGMTEEADPTSVNLAQRIQDEMVIFVASERVSSDEIVEKGSQAAEKISINRASASEMEKLNGIGPSKAASIIKYREENGPFSSLEDLVNVPGIGEKTLENLKEMITVP